MRLLRSLSEWFHIRTKRKVLHWTLNRVHARIRVSRALLRAGFSADKFLKEADVLLREARAMQKEVEVWEKS
jgi:hypothetical protein